jgi:hypothetical protein
MADQERIARLAKQIGDEVRKDQPQLLTEADALVVRRKGAAELHAVCAAFVASVNRLLSPPILELTPPEYVADAFRETGANLFQLNAQGRIIQIVFGSTRDTFSTEKFLIPYVLEGEVRAYNQELLERMQVRTQALFFCLEDNRSSWRYFDYLQGRSGVFNQDQLVTLLERLV